MQQTFDTSDGRRLHLRPVCAEDAARLQHFFAGLSAASRRCRFHGAVKGISAAHARRLSLPDPHLEAVYVVATPDDDVVAEARYSVGADRDAEFAVAVADGWTGLGLARRLLAQLMASARRAGLRTLHGDVLADNTRMLALMQAAGFALFPHSADPGLLRVEFDLSIEQPAPAGWWAALAFVLPLRGALFQRAGGALSSTSTACR